PSLSSKLLRHGTVTRLVAIHPGKPRSSFGGDTNMGSAMRDFWNNVVASGSVVVKDAENVVERISKDAENVVASIPKNLWGEPALQSITISPADCSIDVGGQQEPTATGVYSDRSSRDVTTEDAWVISGSPPVVDVDTNGLSSALRTGEPARIAGGILGSGVKPAYAKVTVTGGD